MITMYSIRLSTECIIFISKCQLTQRTCPMSEVTLTVLLFAKARELVGSSSVTTSVPASIRYSELLSHLEAEFPGLQRLGRTFVLSLNENYIDQEEELVLTNGDEIAVIPPISGG